jgi:hypothetical protein
VATSGALQNITSYLNGTLANLGSAFHGSNEYITQTLGVPPGVVYSTLAALVAVPFTMSRYGWSTASREGVSPYSSMTGGIPNVTDEDFSYITSQELDDPNLGVPLDSRYHPRSHSSGPADPEDDILLIKNKGVTYPAHFPAYAIGDGKLRVKDVRERVGILMDLSSKGTRRIKLLYKGRQLKEPAAPIRDYGVKNKSELMAVLPEIHDGSSPSEEEMVIVSDADRKESKSQRKRKKRNQKKNEPREQGDADSLSSPQASTPRDSNSNLDPPRSPQPPKSPSPAAASGPMKKLDELSSLFKTKWLPACIQYTASPPSDPKKRVDEHRKISESVLQQILLALDGVETDGNPDIRARRKDLVRQVQEVLKQLDAAKDGTKAA